MREHPTINSDINNDILESPFTSNSGGGEDASDKTAVFDKTFNPSFEMDIDDNFEEESKTGDESWLKYY